MKWTIDRPALLLGGLLLALVTAEQLFVPHLPARFPWHHLPGYAGAIGLLACLFVVQVSKALGRRLLQRPVRDDD